MTKEAVEYIKFFVEHEEEVTWILRQQEKLRLEYIMFLKKDLPEILNRQGIRKLSVGSVDPLAQDELAGTRERHYVGVTLAARIEPGYGSGGTR